MRLPRQFEAPVATRNAMFPAPESNAPESPLTAPQVRQLALAAAAVAPIAAAVAQLAGCFGQPERR